jgi:XTP/dITP diphosphohydrolase
VTPRVLLATRNPGKVEEVRRILSAAPTLDVELVGLGEVPDFREMLETGRTFADNALAKARYAAETTGMPCVADDSGLCVDVLNGMPGLLSARWAGRHGDDEANTRLLLAQLDGLPRELRAASFRCVAAAVVPGVGETTAEGEMLGGINTEPRGTGGFGYDPIFHLAGEDRTTAELTAEEKDRLSHRGRAFRALAPLLAEMLKPSARS